MKTINSRLEKVKKLLAGLEITVVASISVLTGEYYVNPDIDLMGDKYTGYKYAQIRKEMGGWGHNFVYLEETPDVVWKKQQLYTAILNKEAQKCGALYSVSSKQDIRSLVKKFDELGCPK